MLSKFLRTAVATCALAFAIAVNADDSYYRVKLDDLKIAEGALPKKPTQENWRAWSRLTTMRPYAVLDRKGEVYVDTGNSAPFTGYSYTEAQGNPDREAIVVRTAQTGDVTGRLFYPRPDGKEMVVLKFTIPAAAAKDDGRQMFYRAKESYYKRLMAGRFPGGAWFRHEVSQAQAALNTKPGDVSPNAAAQPGPAEEGELAETYALFSGGRALSENLQLDRAAQGTKTEEPTIDVDSLEGITVREIDWKPLAKDINPQLDPLAASIPADQHVIFFPTFSAAVSMADQAKIQGTAILHLAEPRSEDARTAERYQRQLCLSLTGLGRLLGPKVAKSVALTGSDPYFRTGTDVAVLFEAEKPALLENLLMAQIAVASSNRPGVKPENGEIDGLAYRGVRSPDRSICSYVARLDHTVIVTNSLYQLGRLAGVANKKSASIASLPEYVFFRGRYRLGDPEESAFVFLSDATIRRWCGPRWRIATSRQTRDMAVLAELQAANMDRLAKKVAQPGAIYTDFATADVGELSLDAQGVHSSVQGSLEFMTPIAELPMRKVTKAEADAFRRWRDGYQANWRWAFDPIALRLTLQKKRLAADLTVMPLIFGTQYREMAALSEGVKITPDAGDPHGAPLHYVQAINTKSQVFARTNSLVATISQGVTLGWLGSSVAFYADDDPVWAELAKIPSDKLWESFPYYIGRLPIAVRAEVSSGFRLTAFLAAARTFIEQTAPGMAQWEAHEYKGQPYVTITPTERAKGQHKELEKVAVYYAASGDALLATFSENVLKHAIDRQLARAARARDSASTVPVAATQPWLGSSVALHADRKAIDFIGIMSYEDRQLAMQSRAWSNLPILNEWKRLDPDCDPVELHERVWKIRLICPGGGRYVWNDKYQTMESTVYGHPGEPKIGPVAAPVLGEFSSGDFGLTFENRGLRARLSLEKTADAGAAKGK